VQPGDGRRRGGAGWSWRGGGVATWLAGFAACMGLAAMRMRLQALGRTMLLLCLSLWRSAVLPARAGCCGLLRGCRLPCLLSALGGALRCHPCLCCLLLPLRPFALLPPWRLSVVQVLFICWLPFYVPVCVGPRARLVQEVVVGWQVSDC
jgi:hypothetical protein